MTRRPRISSGLALAAATAIVVTGCDAGTEREAELDTDTLADQPAMDMTAQQEMYEARLEAVDGSGVSGTATVTVEGDEVQVTVAATGLEPGTRVPMHIHMNATCDDAGGIFLNLDDGLSAPGEGEARGDAYPEASEEGALRLEASRSLTELRTAMGQGAEAATAEADTGRTQTGMSMDMLELGNRVINLHGADMQAISCGALERMDHGQG